MSAWDDPAAHIRGLEQEVERLRADLDEAVRERREHMRRCTAWEWRQRAVTAEAEATLLRQTATKDVDLRAALETP